MIVHVPCIKCGSSDACATYEDGTYCFSCGYKSKEKGNKVEVKTTKPFYNGQVGSILERGITKDTVIHYGVRLVAQGNEVVEHQYPYFDKGSTLIGVKHRVVKDKSFFVTGVLGEACLFGSHLFSPDKHKTIIITEGELDTLATYQMLRGRAAVVSLINGAAGAKKDIQKNLEYLSSFENVILCFDNDDVGRESASKCADLFKVGQLKIMRMTGYKDACDYLINKKWQEFEACYLNAESFRPDGIIGINSFKGILKKLKYETVEFKEWPFKGIQKLTSGIRLGELITVTAFTSIGKSAFMKEVAYSIFKSDSVTKIGMLFLEEKNSKTITDLCSIDLGIPLHIHDFIKDVPDHVLEDLENKVFSEDRVHIFNHFGSNDIDNICSKIRYMAQGCGVKYVFLDHISILVSDQSQGDERKTLDEVSTKLKTLAIELDIAIIACVHLNREGKIRGSAAIGQLSDIVIKLYRDKLATDPRIANTTRVIVVKNRFTGREGVACDLEFDNSSWRMTELDNLIEYDIVKAASESVV